MATKATILKALAYLAAATPWLNRMSAEEKAMRLEVAGDQWGDIDDTLLLAAVTQAVSEMVTDRDSPGIGTIRNKALGLVKRSRGDIDAMTAWGAVMEAARGKGRDTTKDELRAYFVRHLSKSAASAVMVIVGRMGWRDICNCDEDQLNTLRAQFRGAWDTEQSRERERQLMTPQVAAVVKTLAANMDMNRLLSARREPQLEDGAQ
jgi:hypothetical protein